MARLVRADRALRDTILDDTHALWHDGLSRRAYARYNEAQLQTRWGAAHLARVALVDGSHLLASAKQYDMAVTIDGMRHRAIGIGAVFTEPRQRRRGHATELIERLLEQATADGYAVALLFSEIGVGFYSRLGFSVVPIREVDVSVARRPGAPALLIRGGEERDLPFIAESNERLASKYRFSLAWDADWLQYSIVKKRLLAALGPPGQREVEFFVTEEGGRPAGWVLLQVTGRQRAGYVEAWSLEACGDRDPAGARIGAMLQALIARTPSATPPLIRAWWPPGLQPPQLTLHERRSSAITLMVRTLGPAAVPLPPLSERDVLYWHGDAF